MYNNPYLQQYNNLLQPYSGFSVFPVGKIEEVKTIFPDLQGKPLFFFDQSRNEFFVKQRNVETGEVQTLRYKLSNEPLNTVSNEKDTNYFNEQIQQLKSEIERLNSAICVKARKNTKEVNEDVQPE